METVGVSRFKVLRHGFVDGYVVGKIERVDDISLFEEEVPGGVRDGTTGGDGSHRGTRYASGRGLPSAAAIITKENIDSAPTRELFEFAHGFAKRMDHQSLAADFPMLAIYGECPDDLGHLPPVVCQHPPRQGTGEVRAPGYVECPGEAKDVLPMDPRVGIESMVSRHAFALPSLP